jgi:hypothetical protein
MGAADHLLAVPLQPQASKFPRQPTLSAAVLYPIPLCA